MFDCFLSELSISDAHGGGITLQRLLGDDLDGIDRFVHLSRYGDDHPPAQRVALRSIGLTPHIESHAARQQFGYRAAYRISQTRFMQRRAARSAAKQIARLLPRDATSRLFVCPQGKRSLLTVDVLRTLRDVRYVTWFMDDHLLRWAGERWRYPAGVESLMRRHLTGADKVLVISPAMRQFYASRFGAEDAIVLVPPTDDVHPPVMPGQSVQGVRLAYFGNLSSWANDALRRMAPYLAACNAELTVYSPGEQDAQALPFDRVTMAGRVPRSELLQTMRSYDAIVLPISFAAGDKHMVDLNIATRMSEYLGSGNLVLAVGPDSAAMVRYLKERDCAVVVTEPAESTLIAATQKVQDAAIRRRILERAQAVVGSELTTEAVRRIWQQATKPAAPEIPMTKTRGPSC